MTKKTNSLNHIFELQKALNDRCGVKSEKIQKKEKKISKWVLNYTRAYSQEFAELQDSLPWRWWDKDHKYDPQNAKVEIIDLFHFAISLCQVTGMSSEKLTEILDTENSLESIFEKNQKTPNTTSPAHLNDVMDKFKDSALLVQFKLSEINDLVPWKWWAKYQKINIPELHTEIAEIFMYTVGLAHLFEMNGTDIYEGYLKKNKVNHNRQNSGYTEKDHEDSRHI